MATNGTPKVLKVTESADLTPAGTVATFVVVQFVVGDHGPFTLKYLPAEFSASRVQADMNARARELQQLGA